MIIQFIDVDLGPMNGDIPETDKLDNSELNT